MHLNGVLLAQDTHRLVCVTRTSVLVDYFGSKPFKRDKASMFFVMSSYFTTMEESWA